ncbi:MAG: tetratricopeptide repeat protein [Aureispira sp.]|nr:tetratricopeptide repeat protein [Aureispira sp.]
MAAKKRSKKNNKNEYRKKIKETPVNEYGDPINEQDFEGGKSKKRKKPIAEIDAPPSFWNNYLVQMLCIGFLSAIIYSNTISHNYAVDDTIVILRNEFTKKGMKGMHGIWTEDTFVGFFGDKRNLVSGGRYRPLSVATFALELQLFGTVVNGPDGQPQLDKDGDVTYKGSPHLSHAVNILMYAILCMVLYLMLLQMFNPKRDQNNLKGYFIAFAGALLYAAHPIHTEAIANIKGRDEIMVTLGGILTIYLVLKMAVAKKQQVLYMIGAVVAFLFAIFSKENAITFLAIIPAALYFFTEAKPDKIAIYTAPFAVIAVGFWFLIRQPILGTTDAAPIMELMNNPFLKLEGGRYVEFTSSEKYGTILHTWMEYIRLMVYPHPLTNDYYPKYVRTVKDIIPNLQSPYVLLSIIVHLGMAAATVWGIMQRKAYAFFLIFYAATFSVVSNLFFPIGTNMAERFLFLPSVGFSGLCSLGLYHLATLLTPSIKKLPMGNLDISKHLKVSLGILGIATVLYSAKTYSRNFAWKDDYTLFVTDIENSPNSAKLNNAVSGVLQDTAIRMKTDLEREPVLVKALKHSHNAISMHPTYNNAWLLYGNANIHLGNLKQRQQNYPEAGKFYTEAIKAYVEVKRLRPDHPDVERNLGVAYRDQGKLQGQFLGNLDASIQSLEQALVYNKSDFEIFRLVGVAYGIKGMQTGSAAMHQKAIANFEKALELNPQHVAILFNLEVAYRTVGDQVKAQEYHDRWFAINPEYNPKTDQN